MILNRNPMLPRELQRIRYNLNLTQMELAHQLGMSCDRAIRRWERSEVPIPGPVRILLRLMAQQVATE